MEKKQPPVPFSKEHVIPKPAETVERLNDGDLKIQYGENRTIYIQNVVVSKEHPENLMAWRVAALKRIEAGCKIIDNILGNNETYEFPDMLGEIKVEVTDTILITRGELQHLRDVLMGNEKTTKETE